jgi:hypothetical protein
MNYYYIQKHFSFDFLPRGVQTNATWLLYCMFFISFSVSGQNEFKKEDHLKPLNNFDIVPVEVNVSGAFVFETDIIITDTAVLYLNIEELFNNLGIFIKVDNNRKLINGFIDTEAKKYTIDVENSQISIGTKNIRSLNGIVQIMNTTYIESNLLAEAFGLRVVFNSRSLSIKLDSDFELPKLKQERLENMRDNISKLQSNLIGVSDTIVGRKYHIFKAGTLNWAASTFETSEVPIASNFGLSLGSEFLYGETNLSFFISSQNKFDTRQLQYNWRWVDNEKKYIKQAQVGKIYSQSIAFLSAPLVGVTFTNSSNAVRKAKGNYIISEYTEPNWTIELYINDALVDYTAADASGLFLFKVPIVYGYSALKLKFYGLLGEERVEERTMNIPYTFMPPKVLEYNVAAGILEDEKLSQYGRGEFNYGFSRFVTIGGGVEYLSSIAERPVIPFANVAFQPFSQIVVNMEYVHNVSMKGLANYYIGKSAFLELDYRKYVEGQVVTLNRTKEERSIRFSFPLKLSKIAGNIRVSYNQFVYSTFNYNSLDAIFSGRYRNYSANASLSSNWISNRDVFLTSNLTLSYKMTNGLIIRPLVEYNISDNQLLRYSVGLEKRVAKMSLSASYIRNAQNNTNNFLLSYSYDFNFARAYSSAAYSNKRFNFAQSAQGSLALGGDNGCVKVGNNSAIGKGGILMYPFLDLNQNGKKDPGEKNLFVENVKISNGQAITSKKDSIVRISDLSSFIDYKIEFLDADLESISWKFKHNSYSVLVDPNQYKKVEVPILVMGEVSGMVYLNTEENLKGLGRVTVQIYDAQGKKVAETLSESDGYFSYLGLKPGKYSVLVDEEQLKKLDYQSTPKAHEAFIKITEYGTIVDGLDFNIKSIDQEVLNENAETIKPDSIAISSIIDQHVASHFNTSFGEILDQEGLFYSVQIGVFKNYVHSEHLLKFAPVFYEFLSDRMIRYISGKYDSKNEAKKARNKIIRKGVKDAYIVKYNNSKKIDTATIRN